MRKYDQVCLKLRKCVKVKKCVKVEKVCKKLSKCAKIWENVQKVKKSVERELKVSSK